MRTIKFRAFDKEKKRMFNVYGLGQDWVTEDTMDGVDEGNNAFHGIEFFNRIEVMQYTGLKDKNGKEIYEGDIIQYKHYSANKRWWSTTKEIPKIEQEVQKQRDDFSSYKAEVVFKNGCFVLNWGLNLQDVYNGQKFEKGTSHSCDYEKKSWDFEVIGNIHENQDLLK